MGQLSSASTRAEEISIIAELKAGSEEAYAWLIAQYHQPVYSLVYRILDDSSDAPDTTQDIFLKVFRGIKRFNGESSLKTWIYRIAIHEASNRRRWWFRHKLREASIDSTYDFHDDCAPEIRNSLIDDGISPLQALLHAEARERIEQILRELQEPYRTTVILRDIEELSYEQIAEVTDTSLGTVKSRIVRGREQLRRRLLRHVGEIGPELGLNVRDLDKRSDSRLGKSDESASPGNQKIEVPS